MRIFQEAFLFGPAPLGPAGAPEARLHAFLVELVALLTDVARAQRPIVGPKGIAMNVEASDAELRLVADERRLADAGERRKLMDGVAQAIDTYFAADTLKVASR